MQEQTQRTPFYDQIERWIIIVLFSIMTVITFFTVCSRYFFSFTFSWAEQMTRLLLVWISFAGISWAGRINVHNRVTVVAFLFGKKERIAKTILVIGDLVGVLFGLYMAYQTGIVMMRIMASKQMMPSMLWCPKWVMYLPGVLGMIGMSLRILQRLYHDFRTGKEQSTPVAQQGGVVD